MNSRRYWNVVITSIGGFMGQNLMQVVDLLFCRSLGAEGSATVGSATALCAWFIIIGLGVMWSLEYFIPHSLGSKDEERAQSFYYSGLAFATLVGLVSGVGLCLAAYFAPRFGIQATIIPGLQTFCYIVSTSYLPIFVTSSARIELQARGFPHEMTLAFIYGNLVNILLNYMFVLGHFGMPAMGTNGSAWANTLSRYGIMIYVLIRVYQVRRNVERAVHPRNVQYRKYLKEIWTMGFPTALHMVFEIGAFALVGTLAGQFENAKIAAHTIAISIASLAFMIPMGMSSATSLLMSEANGQMDRNHAVHLGWTTIRLGCIYAVVGSIVMITLRGLFVSAYTADEETIRIGSSLLMIAAIFQFGDAMQVILAGCIRGFGETKIQAKINGIGHWLVGLPIGLYLGYVQKMDVVGFWIGLCTGLFTVALGLFLKWRNLATPSHSPTSVARTPH
ncbi:MAG: MATE family efflux transporter [Bdellovibrionales bacterium]|nr:MATE family efflux transporter [Bdellovibrionales bacterium]